MLQGFRIFETTEADLGQTLTDDSRNNGMTDSCDISMQPIIPLLSDQNRLKICLTFLFLGTGYSVCVSVVRKIRF